MMPSLSTFRSLSMLLACVPLLLPSMAQAARSYQVDLVVFTLESTPSGNDETFPDSPPPLNPARMSRAVTPQELLEEMATPAADSTDESAAPVTGAEKEKEVSFDRVLARLRSDPRRKILLSTSWVQAVEGPDTSRVIRITDQREDDTETTTRTSLPSRQYAPASPAGMPIDASILEAEQPPVVDGYASFYLSGYYTLELDVRYTPEVSFLEMEDPANPKYTSYRIYEKRRMKSDELNYYDHPRFGVLLLVNPAETPASAPES
mgnify:FL=1